ncbi:MAG: EamA family transporter [bacterium]
MPLPILLALVSMLAQGASDFLYKKAQDSGIALESYLLVEAVPFAATALLFGYLLGDASPNRAALVYGPIFGVFSFCGIFLFVTSLREGEAGVNTLIFRLNFVLAALIAILFLGERWTASLGAGLLLAVLAIASVTILGGRRGEGGERGGKRVRLARPAALAALAMLFFAVLNIIFKVAVSAGGNVAFLIFFGACAWMVCAFSVMVARRRFHFPANNWRYLPMTGCLKSVAFFLMLYAFRAGGAASVVVPIVQLSFLVTVALAVLFLGERIDRTKGFGLAFALAALFMLSR